MTDDPRPNRTARMARALLAATTSVVPIALWSAEPAAAAPGPLDLTSDGCMITGTGTDYDELRLSVTVDGSTRPVGASSTSTVSSTYGQWLLPVGKTATVTLEGWDAGAVVGSETMTVPTCATGTTVRVSTFDVGTPDPAADEYTVGLRACGSGGLAHTLLLPTAGPAVLVPVLPDVDYCTGVASSGSSYPTLSGFTVEPSTVSVADGDTADVVVYADWISTRVILRARWLVGGQLVDTRPAGFAPSYEWTTYDGPSVAGSGTCGLDGSGSGLDCNGDVRLRPGGAIEVSMAGGTGWALHGAIQDESDCTMVDGNGVPYCALDLVHVPTGQPQPQQPSSAGVCDPAASNPFADVDPGSTHGANVVCAAELGLVAGGPGGLPATQFGPTLTTSRAQLATLVRNLLVAGGVVLPQGAPDAFDDDDGTVHEASIDLLAALGVIGGNGEAGDAFAPSRPATRSEIASFLHRAYEHLAGAPLPDGPNAFVDDDGDPAEDAIDALAAAGIVAGKAPGRFDPTGTVTREQIATVFVQLLADLEA